MGALAIIFLVGAVFGAGFHATEQKVTVATNTEPVVVQEAKSPVIIDRENQNYISPTRDILASKEFAERKRLLQETGFAYKIPVKDTLYYFMNKE